MHDTAHYNVGVKVKMLVPSTAADHLDEEHTMPVGSIGVITAKSRGGAMFVDIEVNSCATISVIYDPEDDGPVEKFMVPADEAYIRESSISDINDLYGLTGNDLQRDLSESFLLKVIREMGPAALTTEALARIARLHRAEDMMPRKAA